MTRTQIHIDDYYFLEELYLIPLDSISMIQSKPSLLKQFQREVVDKWLSIEEFTYSRDIVGTGL